MNFKKIKMTTLATTLLVFVALVNGSGEALATNTTELVEGNVEVNKRVEKFTLNNQGFFGSGHYLEKSKNVYKISEVYQSRGTTYYLLRLTSSNVGVGWVEATSVEFVTTFVDNAAALNDVGMIKNVSNKFGLPTNSTVLSNSFHDTNNLKGQVLRITDEVSTKANENYLLLRNTNNVGIGWVEKSAVDISPKQKITKMEQVDKYGVVIKTGNKYTVPNDNLNVYQLNLLTNELLNKEVRIFSEMVNQTNEEYSLIGINSPICWVKTTDLKIQDTFIRGNGTLKSAHRGFSLSAPENTLAAIQAAKLNEFDMVEIDVQLTKDNELILMHDATVDRMTNGKGKVSDKTLAELKNLSINMQGYPNVAQQKIPTLDQGLKEIAKLGLGINIDGSKMDMGNKENLNRIVALLKTYDLYNKSFFVLDEPARSLALSEHPSLPVTFTTNGEVTLKQDIATLKTIENGFYSTAYVYLTDNLISQLKENNIPLHVYGVNSQEEFEYCKKIGARFVETDVLIK